MKDKMSGESVKDLEVIIVARNLMDWVFRAAGKKPKVKEEDFEANKNNGLPKKYKNVGDKMEKLALDTVCLLQDARFVKEKRKENLIQVLSNLTQLNECLWFCYRKKVIRKNSKEEGEKMVTEVKKMTLAWLKNVRD